MWRNFVGRNNYQKAYSPGRYLFGEIVNYAITNNGGAAHTMEQYYLTRLFCDSHMHGGLAKNLPSMTRKISVN